MHGKAIVNKKFSDLKQAGAISVIYIVCTKSLPVFTFFFKIEPTFFIGTLLHNLRTCLPATLNCLWSDRASCRRQPGLAI